jgi:polysaccharide export outer membrane protein
MRFTTLFAIVALLFGAAGALNAQERSYGASEFQLGPGDVIDVSVYKEPDLSATVPVRPDGKISLPLIGELPAKGMTAVELQKEVGRKLSQYIANPVVIVIVKEVNSAQVSVLGEVRTPGMYKLTNRATVLDAVALAGGFTEYAKRNKVVIIRDEPAGKRYIQLNVEEQLKGKRTKSDLFYVLPYDKIYVQ